MKHKKTNLWKITEKVDRNGLRVVLFTAAFSNWSKDFTRSKAWLIAGHQYWDLEALFIWEYHKFWKKYSFQRSNPSERVNDKIQSSVNKRKSAKINFFKKHFQKCQQAHNSSMWSKINKNHINKSSTEKFKRIYMNSKEIDTNVERMVVNHRAYYIHL